MRKITLIEAQELVNRTKELLGPVWSMNSTENSSLKKKQEIPLCSVERNQQFHLISQK